MLVILSMTQANSRRSQGMMCLIFLICSLRINVAFFVVFFTLGAGFSCLAGAYWNLALAYENGSNLAAAARAASLFQVTVISCIS